MKHPTRPNQTVPDSPFWQEKAWRTERFFRWRYGHKSQPCTACNGSGYYDSHGSPKCGGCDGTRVETYPGPKSFSGKHEELPTFIAAVLARGRDAGPDGRRNP